MLLVSTILVVQLLASGGCWGPQPAVAAGWFNAPNMPLGIAEGSSGIVRGPRNESLLLVMGDNKNSKAAARATLALDLSSNVWHRKASRLHIGHHMVAVTYGNRLYLIGGFLDESTNNVQIYDPVKDTWTRGPVPPVRSGAAAAALLNDTIYYCGGLRNGNQRRGPVIADCAKLHVPSGKWTSIAPMKHAVHHHSMGTDGNLIYVFGGRNISRNVPSSPVDYVQIYNPISNTWRSSTDKTGGPRPMPVGRGGMGPAVFIKGHFYIFGGETACGKTVHGSCPNNNIGLTSAGVFTLVDRFEPVNGRWDRSTPMTAPRHGIYPVLGPAPSGAGFTGQAVYVCGGGVKAGYSDSTVCTYWTSP